jgi:D-lactate dehydrogenase
MKIVFLGKDRGKFEYIRNSLGNKLEKHEFEMFSKELSDKNLESIKDAEALVLFVDVDINRRIMRDLPELKFIATMSTGFDHIDVESAKEFGICVCNVPAYGASTVAEHTFGLLLNLSRKIYKGIERVKDDDFSLAGLRGTDLNGKTIGVVGAGNIGKYVIKIANGFGMKILVLDRKADESLKRDFEVKFVDLDELLKDSDFITLHVPLTKETRHLINMENVKKIKPGAFLINTSRGEVIETGALRYALDKGILAGAGLDVLEGEEEVKEEIEMLEKSYKSNDWKTLVENNLLIDYDNVIVTPHMAFYSVEAEKRILDTTVKNVMGFLENNNKNKVC